MMKFTTKYIKKHKKIFFAVIFVVVLITSLMLFAGLRKIQPPSQMADSKTESLKKFAFDYAKAIDTNNFKAIYSIEPLFIKENVFEYQFETHMKDYLQQNKIVRQKTTPLNFDVEGNVGLVTTSHHTCSSASCDEDNIDITHDKYIYQDGHWSLPSRVPTEAALNAAAYLYSHLPINEQRTFMQVFSYATYKSNVAIEVYAYNLDNDNELLVHLEDWVDQNKTNGGLQIPVDEPIPARQANTYEKKILGTNCFLIVNGETYMRCYSTE